MSRHALKPADPDVRQVSIGWDRTLGTYYADVHWAGDDNPNNIPTLEIGTDFREVLNPCHAIGFIQDYAEVPGNLVATLVADAKNEGTCEAPEVLGILDAANPAPKNMTLCPPF